MSRSGIYAWLLALVTLQIFNRAQPAETVIKTALGGVPFNQFQDLEKPCHQDCFQYGNCNRELGECECPFGYSGPACQTVLYPACRTTTRPDAPIVMGRTAPRNCYCYKQLLQGLCMRGDELRCASHTLALWETIHCFELVDRPEDLQLSELPDRSDDPAYRWRKGIVVVDPAANNTGRRDFETLSQPPPLATLGNAVQLSKCPSRCQEQGVCQLADDLAQCTCFAGFTGPQCAEQAAPSVCANECGGRGVCLGGFCKCEPPHWGIGCARSSAYEPVPGSLHHPYYPSLKIYVYDVPPSIAGPHQFDDGQPDVLAMHQAFLRFMDKLLGDQTGVRTENPYEANMFYIPTYAFYVTAKLGDPTAAVVRAVDWAASKFPFFNRSEGKDHFVILTSDRGACYLKPLPQTQNLIRLVHFGLERPNITDLGPLVENMEYGCFKGGRDVVLPPYFKPKAQHIRELHVQLKREGGAEELLGKKDVLFFFSGDIRHHEPEYSGGVRQILSELLANASYPDVIFKGGAEPMAAGEYEELLSRSKFCLAPYGHGWGIRLTHALMHACVPVVIQDKVRQPFEDLLHYPDFSVRVSKADLPRLVEILRAVPQEDVLRLTRENARVYRAFLWQPELGGRAYEYTIASLRRRLSHLRGELYEAGTRR